MPRFAGGRRARRALPGVGASVRAHHEKMNAGFCVAELGGQCHWCRVLADLQDGSAVVAGHIVWASLAPQREVARAHADLAFDDTLYRIGENDLTVRERQGHGV